ncbi:MAG: class I SAM-dependent methyltransferase [Firmicutes bacterium]|nr:class I SAM-dependent methyltransferase [Bacillota bacterium]
MAGGLGSAVHLAQVLVAGRVKRGSVVVDATAGKGNDTLFLARLVGRHGKVYAFDIQAAALAGTLSLLERHGLAGRVELILAGHERLPEFVREPVNAVMYNLGYLPGGDRSIVTRPDTTLASLEAALKMLRPGGRISLVCYPGHPGGRAEYEALESFSSSLDSLCYRVIRTSFINRAAAAPVLIAIEKAGGYIENEAAAQNP